MRIATEALFIRVVVRRAHAGAAPFGWEIQGAETIDTIYVSPDKFGTMEAAYNAGQARLKEFMPKARSMPDMTENRYWRSRQNSLANRGVPAPDHRVSM